MSNTNLFIASAGEVPSNIQGQLSAEIADHIPLLTSAAGWDMWGFQKVRTKDIVNVHPRGLLSPSVVVYVQTSDWATVGAAALAEWSASAPRAISPAFARQLVEATDAFDATLQALAALGLQLLPA